MDSFVDVDSAARGSVLGEAAFGGAPSILGKAFAILDTFRRGRAGLSLSQISQRSAMPKSTVHRVIGMLMELGVVERCGTEYRMGSVMFGYGIRTPMAAMREVAAPHLRALASATGQTVQLGVLSGREILYLEKIGGRPALSPAVVGDRLGAHMSALGKAILAFSDDIAVQAVLDGRLEQRTSATVTDSSLLAAELRDVRDRRLAYDREEVVRGLRCVGAPVLVGQRAVAAVSIAYPAAGGSGHVFVSVLREGAARIAQAASASIALAPSW